MRIGIITQPLKNNYGGLLQNYALQQCLKRFGYKVYTINRASPRDIYNISKQTDYTKFFIKQTIKKFLGRTYLPTKEEYKIITSECRKFVEQNIQVTNSVKTQDEIIATTKEYKFDAFVVGSDQVWRPMYSPNIYNDFLDFCKDNSNVKRIAYAASFGVDNWEFTDAQTENCSRLAKLFNAISVREDSAIELCNKFLGVDATLVLDPTLLLEKEDYIELVQKAGEKESAGELFCYILDDNFSIKNAIYYIEKQLSLKSYQVKSKKSALSLKIGDSISEHIIPSPTKWLRAFMDAKMVFTDSFHGCVFSIIFNKPFWVIGNKERGNARFDSLLKLFNLEDRRIELNEINGIDITKGIDWEKVNTIKEEWQKKSLNFLNSHLSFV